MIRFVFSLWFLGWCVTGVFGAQPSIVKGLVTDADTGDPLPGAEIIYEVGKGTVTNDEGEFELHLSAGEYRVTIRYLGYRPHHEKVNLQSGQPTILEVALWPMALEIDQVVVSAGRAEQRIAESTVSMHVIRPQSFQDAHISDTRELIHKSPGIEVIDGQAAIRGGSGFSYGAGSRVLTLVDGLPVLAADAGNIRWQFLPLENLSQIEIIKGASSVLYGSSALNGVINFRTARATAQGRNTFFLETGVFDNPSNSSWKWWDQPRFFSSASFSHLKKYGNTELGLAVSGTKDPGYRKRNHEDLGRINVNLRTHHPNIQGLSYGMNVLLGYTDKKDFVLWENADQGALVQSPATAIAFRGTFLTLDPFISLLEVGRFSHELKTRFQYTDNYFPEASNNNSEAMSFFSEYQARFHYSRWANLSFGASQHSARIRSAFYGDHESFNLAAYTQLELSPWDRLKLVSGIRVEQFSLNNQPDKAVSLFRAGLNYRALNHTFLRASWGQGYRYPSIAERYAATTLGAVKIFPNELLEAESGWNAEVAVKQGVRSGSWEGMIDLAVFYSQNQNLIEYLFGIYPNPATGQSEPGFRADNTEHSRVYGWETEFLLTQHLPNMENTIRGGYVYTYPVEYNRMTGKNTDVFLKYRRKHSASLGLSSRIQKLEPGINLFYKSATLSIDDVFVNENTREDILPGFYHYWQTHNKGFVIMDIHMGWHFNSTYKVSFAIKNLTNKEYMGRPGDIRPHRNYSVRFSATW